MSKIISRSLRLGFKFYKLKYLNYKVLKGFLYSAEHSKIILDKGHMWQIEKILRRRTKNGVEQVLIQWKKFSSDLDTWLNADEIQPFTKH